ncbi:NadR type nicotinamide-nucleotide adenylyltransferase [Hymenobacter luteus]|uniref:NadR type nicotinamide-nucleotide adenylyltransferase n=2 Tax=Hymenobacter TaxID=89966 RepID=A0A7W9WAQ2_9BACT|nr:MULTISPECIES: ATP-binding protein [Hymenobacter]MBB4600115.1 NadR type nicotinamide-nucleotide adenylyltransferase [Hymenobacter latericoloratus]MBB6057575.1 NadR type nicotinamide-nucleotide adenylyltransferase [Hymenobacter luteus]
MLRVALTGPESTGKTTLSRALAEHYHTAWAPEYARQYLEERGPNYTLADLEEIARGQLDAEYAAAAAASRIGKPLVFFDTDLLVIKIWAEHAFGHCPEWIRRQMEVQRYDLVLLLNVDLPWEPDPLREHPNHRQYFYELYQRELRDQFANFAEISGSPAQRLDAACFHIDALLGRNPAAARPLAAPRGGPAV